MWINNDLTLSSPYNPKNWIKRLRRQCEPNQSIFPLQIQTNTSYPPSSTTTSITQAHTITQGQDVHIAIIDSGIDYTHREFTPTLQLNQDPSITPKPLLQEERKPLLQLIQQHKEHPIYDAQSFIDEDPYDDHRHGTTTAGILSSQFLPSVTPKSKLTVLKILDQQGHGTLQHFAKALQYLIQHPPHILTISLAYYYSSNLVTNLLNTLHHNTLIFSAAGNNNSNLQLYPANNPHTIAVNGHNQSKHRWSDSDTSLHHLGSNYGSHIQFAGPSYPQTVVRKLYNRTTVAQGTSLSSPFIAGLAALVMSIYYQTAHTYPTPDTVVKILRASATNLDFLTHDLNQDHTVDILDLALLAKHFYTDHPAYDINQDHTIDILDLVQLAKQFSQQDFHGRTDSLGYADALKAVQLSRAIAHQHLEPSQP